MFVLDEFINRHADNQLVAKTFCIFEQVQMPDMEKIVNARRVAYCHDSSSLNSSAMLL